MMMMCEKVGNMEEGNKSRALRETSFLSSSSSTLNQTNKSRHTWVTRDTSAPSLTFTMPCQRFCEKVLWEKKEDKTMTREKTPFFSRVWHKHKTMTWQADRVKKKHLHRKTTRVSNNKTHSSWSTHVTSSLSEIFVLKSSTAQTKDVVLINENLPKMLPKMLTFSLFSFFAWLPDLIQSRL
jgi:hypothetical protein